MNPELRILHLEDDDADAILVRTTLREGGLNARITLVADRARFLAALKRGSHDLILADYQLPGFDGLDALVLWRDRWPDKPFLFVTGCMGEDLAVESLKCGATDYILKENLARLVPAIQRAVEEAREQGRRRRAEAALRESENRFRNMADNSPFMIWLSGTDKRCSWVNHSWLEFVGRRLEQELGSGWADHVHPDDYKRISEAYLIAFDTRQPFCMEYRRRRHDGVWRWVLDNGAPLYGADRRFTGYIGSCVDVTDRKQNELALRESEARERARAAELEAIMEAVPAVIWLARDPECKVITGNPASYEFLRLPRHGNGSRSAPEGKRPTHFEVLCEGRVLRPEELPVQRAARGEAIRNRELEVRFSDGTSRYLIGNATPLSDAQGHPCGAVAAFVEITERKQAEEALRTSLREKEVLLREVHHRVKNNLQVISSLIGLQADRTRDPGLRALFQDVCNRVRTMALVHEKLYESENLARVDFAEYVSSLLEHLWRAHGQGADGIRLKLDVQPVALPMDLAMPCALLLNEVATNALKHAFPGRPNGEVTVTLHNGPGGQVRLGVRDDGVGLPAEVNWRQSRSLGLQLVQMLAGQLNGTIELESSDGTEFRISFGPALSSEGIAGNGSQPKNPE